MEVINNNKEPLFIRVFTSPLIMGFLLVLYSVVIFDFKDVRPYIFVPYFVLVVTAYFYKKHLVKENKRGVIFFSSLASILLSTEMLGCIIILFLGFLFDFKGFIFYFIVALFVFGVTANYLRMYLDNKKKKKEDAMK